MLCLRSPTRKRSDQKDIPVLGSVQYWITRLGDNSKLPLTYEQQKDGSYPAGGIINDSPETVKAGKSFLLDKRVLKTTNFPPGEYRLSAAYQYPNSTVLDTKSFEFTLK